MKSIAHIQPLFIIDCDETKQSPKSYLQKFGYAPVGEAFQKDPFFINGTAYSTIAAVCPLGYVAWRTFEGNIDHEVFNEFLINSLGPHVLPHHNIVLNNAAIHHVPETRQVIEALFHGNYWYSARYSPHLKPIEPCFALVKEWIRNHEDEAVDDPIGKIDRAFTVFSVGGERATSIRGHWNGYFAHHEAYLEQLNN